MQRFITDWRETVIDAKNGPAPPHNFPRYRVLESKRIQVDSEGHTIWTGKIDKRCRPPKPVTVAGWDARRMAFVEARHHLEPEWVPVYCDTVGCVAPAHVQEIRIVETACGPWEAKRRIKARRGQASVVFDEERGRFLATVLCGDKVHYVGHFEDVKEASEASEKTADAHLEDPASCHIGVTIDGRIIT